MRLHRLPSWLHVRLLELACLFRGHDLDRHFTKMGAMSLEDGEALWCSRCGGGW